MTSIIEAAGMEHDLDCLHSFQSMLTCEVARPCRHGLPSTRGWRGIVQRRPVRIPTNMLPPHEGGPL